jgi:hypothetical protein
VQCDGLEKHLDIKLVINLDCQLDWIEKLGQDGSSRGGGACEGFPETKGEDPSECGRHHPIGLGPDGMKGGKPVIAGLCLSASWPPWCELLRSPSPAGMD